MTFAQSDAVAETVVYNDDNDGSRESDYTTATNAFERELTGNNLKVSNGDQTMNPGFAASWPTPPRRRIA